MQKFKHFWIRWFHQWRELFALRSFRLSLLTGIVILLLAYYVNYRAILYIHQIPVISVNDLILDRIPLVNLTFMYTVAIYFVAGIVIFYPLIFKPELVPFSAKTVGAFVLIRACFISLTHLGAPEGYFQLPQFEDQPGVFKLFYTNDLFFSGHTGFPFLAALLFWENKALRIFLIGMSFAQALTVLFMHVHYSIDVFAAYFITYAIYIVSDKIFNELNLSFKKIVKKIEERMKLLVDRS